MPEGSDSVEESRSATRFHVDPPISAQFGSSAVKVFDFGEGGMQAEHADPLRLTTRGTLAMELPGSPEPCQVRIVVVWSRLSKRATSKGKFLYRSGFRLEEDVETSRVIVSTILGSCFAQPDTDSLERKKDKIERRSRQFDDQPRVRVVKRQAREIAPDLVLLIQHARNHLHANPDESVGWYNRARFSLPPKVSTLRQREDVVATWEYLERSVEIEDVAWVFDHY